MYLHLQYPDLMIGGVSTVPQKGVIKPLSIQAPNCNWLVRWMVVKNTVNERTVVVDKEKKGVAQPQQIQFRLLHIRT